jgi:hypothetical protein
MRHRLNLVLVFVSLMVVLTMPTAHGAGIDVHQHGLTGSWYEPRTSGQGFMVEVWPDLLSPGNGIVFASWLTYDDVLGGAERQRWYTLEGSVASGQTDVPMTIYQNTGGNFNAQQATTEHAVGIATLSFDTCTSGRLVYSFIDGSGRASTIPLTRLMPSVSCSNTSARPTNDDFARSGNLYDHATPGQCLAVEVNPISGVLFFGWMTYAPLGAGAGTGPAGQRWYTGEGAFSSGTRLIAVQLYETTGGLFDEASPTTTVRVGSGTLALRNCDTTLDFNFTGGSSAGASGTIVLNYIGPSACWDY